MLLDALRQRCIRCGPAIEQQVAQRLVLDHAIDEGVVRYGGQRLDVVPQQGRRIGVGAVQPLQDNVAQVQMAGKLRQIRRGKVPDKPLTVTRTESLHNPPRLLSDQDSSTIKSGRRT